jgi:hypothetical protein
MEKIYQFCINQTGIHIPDRSPVLTCPAHRCSKSSVILKILLSFMLIF